MVRLEEQVTPYCLGVKWATPFRLVLVYSMVCKERHSHPKSIKTHPYYKMTHDGKYTDAHTYIHTSKNVWKMELKSKFVFVLLLKKKHI